MTTTSPRPTSPRGLALEDKWILSIYNRVVKEVTDNLEKFELGIAVQKLYDFIWDVFCDWYIELAKARLTGEDEQAKKTARGVLCYVLSGTLKLLHPFMPFITEEIWQTLPHEGETIMLASFPEYSEDLNFADEETEFSRVMEAVRAVRSRRAEMNVPGSKKAEVYIATAHIETFETCAVFFKRLASASEVKVGEEWSIDGAVSIVTSDAKIYIPMDQLIDFEAEKKRLEKEKADTEKLLAGVMAKLNNDAFVSRAPKNIVDNQREAAEKLNKKLALIDESMKALGK